MSIRHAIQKTFLEIGEAGCYFICLVLTAAKILGRPFDFIQTFYAAVDAKYLFYDENNTRNPRNCEVQNSQKIMEFMTGEKIAYHMQPPSYTARDDEYVIEEWELNGSHFVLPDYDPLGESNTRKNGRLKSKRVFKVVR